MSDSDLPSLLLRPVGSDPFFVTSPAGAQNLHGQSLLSIVENYIAYYASGEAHTARAKRYDLRYFLEFLAGTPERIDTLLVAEWTWEKTHQFIDDRLAMGEAPATVSRRLATLKHFGRTLAERVPGFINPAREVKSPVQPVTRPHGLSPVEVEALREAAAANFSADSLTVDFNALRDQLLVELLLATGLRADEVRLLVKGQFAADLQWIRNVKTKGRKFRNVYVESSLRALIETYLSRREHELRNRFPDYDDLPEQEQQRFPVLVSFYGATLARPNSLGMSPKSIWRVIANTGRRAQQKAGDALSALHPHSLRHTFAHGLLDVSKDIRLVAQALGHSDVRTTMRYTERSEDEIAKAIEGHRTRREP